MDFFDYEQEQKFREAWEAVEIVRSVEYGLFTFGESELPYVLICGAKRSGETVSITQGEVRITRPRIITPDSDHPVFQNFFENAADQGYIDFLLSRSAAFSNLKLHNARGAERITSDSVQEAADRFNRKFDAEDEDRIAILTAPPDLGGVAVLRYTSERVWNSAPDNIQDLRERGFLP